MQKGCSRQVSWMMFTLFIHLQVFGSRSIQALDSSQLTSPSSLSWTMAKDKKKKKKNRTGSEKLRARREKGFELLTEFLKDKADKKNKQQRTRRRRRGTSPEQVPTKAQRQQPLAAQRQQLLAALTALTLTALPSRRLSCAKSWASL